MAKDPRFNFYPDNWSGGTKRMNFEQKGAYIELLLLNFYCLSDGLPGFTSDDAKRVLAHAAAYPELWLFLMPKFKTDGQYFWSERMVKEFHKSKKHSEKQTERAKKRWSDETAHAAALPVNVTGNRIGNGIEEKGVQGENFTDEYFIRIFDDIYMGGVKTTFGHLDLDNEAKIFRLKVRGSPAKYQHRDTDGIRQAFIYQLTNSKGNGSNGHKKSSRRADAIIEPPTDSYGKF